MAANLTTETLNEIVHSGILAPSADNQHVFRYELAKDSINLWPSPEFATSKERHRRILGLISLGAVVENMRIFAGSLGLALDAQWLADGQSSTRMLARLTFHESAPTSEGLALAIPVRHTNRRMYRGPALTSAEQAIIENGLSSSNGVKLIWLDGDMRLRTLKLIWLAECERFLRKDLHEEIYSSIRFDLSWHESTQWALPPGALEIEPPMRPIFKAMRHWPLMRVMNAIGAHRLIGWRAGWFPCWQAPTLALLATREPPEQGAIAVGSTLERIWLRSTQLKLGMQPLAASVVLPFQEPTTNGASKSLQHKLISGWQEIVSDATPLMVFRIGRAKQPAVRTGRRPREDYLRKM